MSKTIKQWEQGISKLGDTELRQYRDAIQDLRTWKFFDKEYDWTQYKVIQTLLQQEINTRLPTSNDISYKADQCNKSEVSK